MQIVLTGRQVVVSQKLRNQVEAGLERIEKIVGRKSTGHIVLGATKRGKVAEITVKAKLHDLSSKCESEEIEVALHDCLEKVEKQAIRHKKRFSTMKRHPEKTAVGSVRLQTSDDVLKAQPGVLAKMRGNGKAVLKKVIAKSNGANGHGNGEVEFPSHDFTAYLTRTTKGVAKRPMAMEEALKEVHASDRPLFVFRDLADEAFVLHRLADGRVEVIEVP